MVIKSIFRRKVIDIYSQEGQNKNQDKKHYQGIFLSPRLLKKNDFSSRFLSFVLLFCLVFSIFGWLNVSAPIFFFPQGAEASYDEERTKLEKELQEIEKQIAEHEKILAVTRKEKQTLQNKISELKKKAEKLSLEIKATNLNLDYLNVRLEETTAVIVKTSDKIDKNRENLMNLIQSLYMLQQTSFLEILLGAEELNEYFGHLNALNSVQEKVQEEINEFNNLKITLDKQKQELSKNKEETQKLLAMKLLQKNELEKTKKEKDNLLDITKGNEAKYQQVLTESRKKANEIRSRIYELIGVKTQITFGEALNIATWVGSKINIRPAFLLAVLTQESSLGKNVGTCNRPGDPYEKSWQVVMRPDSREPFLQITKELGLDPNITPVSCPINDPSRGLIAGKNSWGGAMGPAQFMPRTWLGYKNKVSEITGRNPSNPWDVRDAFVAAALYLANHGATKQTRETEWRAAMIYFSGSVNTRFRFYADSVMAIADRYERDIEVLRQIALNK